MKIFQIFKKNSNAKYFNSEYREQLNNTLDYFKFSEVQKRGILFQMGLTLPISSIESNLSPIDQFKEYYEKLNDYINSVLSMYSDSGFTWVEHSTLDKDIFKSNLYNFNHILWEKLLESESVIDDNLKRLEEFDITIGKMPIDNAWEQDYSDLKYNLRNVNCLFYDFIEKNGTHLLNRNYSLEKSYEAGVALYFHLVNHDIKGTQFLIGNLNKNMPPLFSVFREYPIIFKYHKNIFEANHIFSAALQMFTLGIDQNVLGPVYVFHQHIFYEDGTIKFRDIWNFKELDKEVLIKQTFFNAVAIRKTQLYSSKQYYIDSNEILKSEIKNKTLSIDDLFSILQEVIHKKYGYSLNLEILNSGGEFMELIIMLYYEACLHAMVLEDLTN